MNNQLLKYFQDTLAEFETAKAKGDFTNKHKQIIEPLTFAYEKACYLLKEGKERINHTLTDERGYNGLTALNKTTGTYYGRLLDIDDLYTYKSFTLAGRIKEFHKTVDDYIVSLKTVNKSA